MFEIINDTEFEISIGDGKVTVYTSVPNVSCSTSEPGRKLKQLFDILSRAESFNINNKQFYMGFQAIFPNAVVVSVQWGAGNYGANHDVWATSAANGEERLSPLSSDAEVAIWIKGGPWISELHKDGYGGVFAYRTPEQVLHLLQWAERFDVETFKKEQEPLALPEASE